MEKRFTIIYAICGAFFVLLATLIFFVCLYLDTAADRDRIKQNQTILLHNSTDIKETTDGKSHASTPALMLRTSEFKASGDTLTKQARKVGIKPSRIAEAATVATATTVAITAPLITMPDTTHNSQLSILNSQFTWHDHWTSLTGSISDSTFSGTITSTDTLDIIVHRVPKRFLFFRFGCKQVRLDIISRNPHTRLTYARYYQLVK